MSHLERARRYIIIREDHGTPVEIHIVKVPGLMMKGGYRYNVSIEAFRSRMVKAGAEAHFAGKGRPDLYYQVYRPGLEKPHTYTIKGVRKRRWSGLPMSFHDDLFGFYEAIDYDYKAKKFK